MNGKRIVAIPSRQRPNDSGLVSPWARPSARLLTVLISISACAVTSAQQAIKTGPEVGSILPAFEATDQNGRLQNLQSILGPKGALLVFYRSADW
ncbi:MAG TPA: hypothetical protein VKM93_17435 [Terriglobia bacterium]|nr:hypothetical protein [Terriglobia bacterium]